MPSRIYIDCDLSINRSIELPAASCHYVKNVLRLKTDQNIILFNGIDSTEYTARLEIKGKRVIALPISKTESVLESPIHTTIIQALGKPEHIDLLIQKATELGVSQIVFFNSQRTQTHLKASRLEKKFIHWQRIIISACEQCGRNKLPDLLFKSSFEDCLLDLTDDNKLILSFEGKTIKALTEEFTPALPFNMLIGPEGGFTDEEIQQAQAAGFKPCNLGPRVLRMETAAISILNLIQHHFGDMP